MGKLLAAAVVAALFLHWLATVQVVVPVGGFPVAVPVLAVVVLVAVVVTAGLAALVVWRTRAEQAMVAACQARAAAVRAAGGAR
jgi:hypothetical protein